jgi:hypothetical protein
MWIVQPDDSPTQPWITVHRSGPYPELRLTDEPKPDFIAVALFWILMTLIGAVLGAVVVARPWLA